MATEGPDNRAGVEIDTKDRAATRSLGIDTQAGEFDEDSAGVVESGESREVEPKGKAAAGKETEAAAEGGDDTTNTEDDDTEATAADEEQGDDQDDAGDDDGGEELPEFKADDKDVVDKYRSAYVNEGRLDTDKLSSEFWSNKTDDSAGSLNEGTYAFLEDQFGLAKSDVKDIEQALVARREAAELALVERAGGADQLNAALEWARGGGYTESARDRFNKAVGSSDGEVRNEAIDLLIDRYTKANAKPSSKLRPSKKPGGGADPNAPVPVKGYATREDWRKDFHAARDDPAKLKKVHERLAASTWNRSK